MRWVLFALFVGLELMGGRSFAQAELEVLPQEATITDTLNTSDQVFDVFPNPNSGKFTVRLKTPHKEHVTVRIYDDQGRLTDKIHLGKDGFELNFNGYAKGFYWVLIRTGSEVESVKMEVL